MYAVGTGYMLVWPFEDMGLIYNTSDMQGLVC